VLVDDDSPGVEGAKVVPCTVDVEGCETLVDDNIAVIVEDGP